MNDVDSYQWQSHTWNPHTCFPLQESFCLRMMPALPSITTLRLSFFSLSNTSQAILIILIEQEVLTNPNATKINGSTFSIGLEGRNPISSTPLHPQPQLQVARTWRVSSEPNQMHQWEYRTHGWRLLSRSSRLIKPLPFCRARIWLQRPHFLRIMAMALCLPAGNTSVLCWPALHLVFI